MEGDVLVDIEGLNVTHLDYQTLYKFLQKKLDSSITIIFRRHFINEETKMVRTVQKIKKFGQKLTSGVNKEMSTICV
jgi:hypothetical protein